MATRQGIVDYLLDQLAAAGDVSAKRMFGEYGLFLEGKMVAMVCDDTLYFKPTAKGRALCPSLAEAPPYSGAKPCLVFPEDDWDDRDRLAAMARATFDELPVPKKKTKKA